MLFDDPQLIDLLKAFGKRAHVILSNGAHEKQTDDENADARAALKGKIDLQDARLVPSKHLAHNKICVFSDKHGRAKKVWTGSQNWTKIGLCTQANNSLLISDPEIAKQYLEQWNTLLAAGKHAGDRERSGAGARVRREHRRAARRVSLALRAAERQEGEGVSRAAHEAVAAAAYGLMPR